MIIRNYTNMKNRKLKHLKNDNFQFQMFQVWIFFSKPKGNAGMKWKLIPRTRRNGETPIWIILAYELENLERPHDSIYESELLERVLTVLYVTKFGSL